jgi:hypothetical protein
VEADWRVMSAAWRRARADVAPCSRGKKVSDGRIVIEAWRWTRIALEDLRVILGGWRRDNFGSRGVRAIHLTFLFAEGERTYFFFWLHATRQRLLGGVGRVESGLDEVEVKLQQVEEVLFISDGGVLIKVDKVSEAVENVCMRTQVPERIWYLPRVHQGYSEHLYEGGVRNFTHAIKDYSKSMQSGAIFMKERMLALTKMFDEGASGWGAVVDSNRRRREGLHVVWGRESWKLLMVERGNSLDPGLREALFDQSEEAQQQREEAGPVLNIHGVRAES